MKKRLLGIALMVMALVSVMTVSAGAAWDGSDIDTTWYNSTDTTFTISDEADLAGLAKLVNDGNTFSGKTITLGASLDFSNQPWTPIGNGSRSSSATTGDYIYGTYFSGTFDGGSNTIEGLKVEQNVDNTGAALFGIVNDATIKNITVSDSSFANSIDAAAAVVGIVLGTGDDNMTYIDNCKVTSDVTVTGNSIAGVVGRLYGNTTIDGCSNAATVTSSSKGGGIACIATNDAKSIVIENCSNSGTVTATSSGAAGIMGYMGNVDFLAIENCSNSGNIGSESDKYVGGIIGYGTSSATDSTYTVKSCSNSGTLTGINTGGIAGLFTQSGYTLTSCTNSGNINGSSNAGGIIGSVNGCNFIENCSNTGDVTGTRTGTALAYHDNKTVLCVGGIAGSIGGFVTIKDCSGGGSSALLTITNTNDVAYEKIGRIVGNVSNSPYLATPSYLYIDDSNGDDYTSLPTVGGMGGDTAWAGLVIEAGTLTRAPSHITAMSIIKFREGTAWVSAPNELSVSESTFTTENIFCKNNEDADTAAWAETTNTNYNQEPVARIGFTFYKGLADPAPTYTDSGDSGSTESSTPTASDYAIESAVSGDTITLLRDTELDAATTAIIDAGVTLDLNGNTLTMTAGATLTNSGTIVVNDEAGLRTAVAAGGNVELGSNIELSRCVYIATADLTLDGKNHTITTAEDSYTTGSTAVLGFLGCDGGTIKNLTLELDIDDANSGLFVNDAENVIFSNIIIDCGSTEAYGIIALNNSTLTVSDLTLKNITASTETNMGDGIRVQTGAVVTASEITVTNCDFYYLDDQPITVYIGYDDGNWQYTTEATTAATLDGENVPVIDSTYARTWDELLLSRADYIAIEEDAKNAESGTSVLNQEVTLKNVLIPAATELTINDEYALTIKAGGTVIIEGTVMGDGSIKGTDATSTLIFDGTYGDMTAGSYSWDDTNNQWDMTYTLTVSNSGDGTDMSGSYVEGEEISISAGSRSSYSFNGWTSSNGGTFASASSNSTTFTMPAGDVTISTSWSANSSGSSSSSSGSSSSSTTTTDTSTTTTTVTTATATTTTTDDGATVTESVATTSNETTGETTVTTATATTTTTDDGATVTETVATTSNETTGDVTESTTVETVTDTATTVETVAATTTSAGDVIAETTTVIADTATATEITATVATENGETAVATIVAVATEDTTDVTIPQTVLTTVAAESTATVTVETPVATIELCEIATNTVAEAVAASEDTEVVISAVVVESAVVSDTITADLNNIVVVDLTVSVGGQNVSSFNGGTAVVTIPYTAVNENAPITLYYVADDGSVTLMDSTYDAENGVIVFETGHFSYYMVSENTAISFTDVSVDEYYYDAVKWAVENLITSGTTDTTFSPNNSCTRAQAVTFLWRAAGEPEVDATSAFTDLDEDEYYYNAVLWAVSEGITSGTTATTFSPDATCSRAQIVTFLYRNADEPEVTGENPFTDLDEDEYYMDAILWVVENSITSGTTATTFAPSADCTRGQIVTFLYRALAD